MLTRSQASRKGNPADPPGPPDRKDRGLLSVRSALIILFAVLAALGGAGLLYLAYQSVALAIFMACGVFALGLKFFNDLIELPGLLGLRRIILSARGQANLAAYLSQPATYGHADPRTAAHA